MKCSEGFKKITVRGLLHPDSPGISEISKDTGASTQTLYNWIKKFKESIALADQNKTPEEWTLPEKSKALFEYAALSPEEKGEWLRRNGLHSDHIALWEKEVQEALIDISSPISREEQKRLRKKVKEQEKEIRRKDKILAEMSALNVLK